MYQGRDVSLFNPKLGVFSKRKKIPEGQKDTFTQVVHFHTIFFAFPEFKKKSKTYAAMKISKI